MAWRVSRCIASNNPRRQRLAILKQLKTSTILVCDRFHFGLFLQPILHLRLGNVDFRLRESWLSAFKQTADMVEVHVGDENLLDI